MPAKVTNMLGITADVADVTFVDYAKGFQCPLALGANKQKVFLYDFRASSKRVLWNFYVQPTVPKKKNLPKVQSMA